MLLACGQVKCNLHRSARIKSCPGFSREVLSRHSFRIAKTAIAPDKFCAVSRKSPRRIIYIEETNTVPKLLIVGIPGKQGPAFGIHFSNDMHNRFWLQVTQNPLYITRSRKTARPV